MIAYHDPAGQKIGLQLIIMVLASRISAGVNVSKSTVTQIICSDQTTIPTLLQVLIEYLVVGTSRVRRFLLYPNLSPTSGHLPRFLSVPDQISSGSLIPFTTKLLQCTQNYSFQFQIIAYSPIYWAALSPAYSLSIWKPVCKFCERRWC
jgi:hypothetical protein